MMVNLVGIESEREHIFHNMFVSVPEPPKECFLLTNGVSIETFLQRWEMVSPGHARMAT